MKLFLILIAAAAACFFGWTAFNKIINPSDKVAAFKASTASGVSNPVLPTTPGVQMIATGGTSVSGIPPMIAAPTVAEPKMPVIQTVMVYTFKNRPVPPTPFGRDQSAVGGGQDSHGVELSIDLGSNSWVMRGPPDEVQEVSRIAGFLDVTQDELDLDFLLVTVSENWLRSFGITASYQEGASWLPSFSLGTGTSGLRIASNGFAVDLSASIADNSASVYSAPVVRVVTGEKWAFGADRDIPIASSSYANGLQQNSYTFRSVGLGFSGSLSKAGPSGAYRLQVEQRNGDAETTNSTADGVPPVIRTQLLQTSLVVEVGRWSCVGGVSSWRKEKKRQLLGTTDTEEQNLLLVFVRARDALTVAPVAYPVGQGPEHLDHYTTNAWDLGPNESGVLPPKNWLDKEIRSVEKKIRSMGGPPGK